MTVNNEHEQLPATPAEPNDFQKFMRSHTARFLIVGVISILLLLPLEQIRFLIEERKTRQLLVTEQLKTEWGDKVSYYGLVLKVPVMITESVTNVSADGKPFTTQSTETHTGYFYPEESTDFMQTAVSEKYRGIFKTVIFNAGIQGKSTFNIGKIVAANPGKELDWEHAKVAVVTNKNAHFKELSDIVVNAVKRPVESNETAPGNDSIGVIGTAPFAIDPSATPVLTASVSASVNGSGSVLYKPLAGKSKMTMRSNWKDPAFAGSSLPNSNSLAISKKGFSGSWNNLTIAGACGQLHLDALHTESAKTSEIRFIKLVDQYQLNERTVKYGLLVFILTFAVFFLIQIVGKVMVHPLHYFMIGLALLLFYSLLLSFSEQIGFIPAYLLASAAIILLIVWYAKSILKSFRFALMSGISLGLLYAFLLVIVNLEVYALIVGSLGLLFVLAAIMSVTRKLSFENA